MLTSLIICTHNPRKDYLLRTLASLRAETLPLDEWELLLIDNASEECLGDVWDISWHPRARHVREDELGLTPARLRGIRESSGELLLFVDDDNVLAPNYLEAAVAIAKQYTYLGVFGAGILEPEFETSPPPEITPWLSMLALRKVAHTLWGNNSLDAACIPWGAGLCVTRAVALRYSDLAQALDTYKSLDRRGSSLYCGGDDLFSWASARFDQGFGLFPQLQLIHLISARRLTRDYLLRLIHDHAFSHGVLRHLLASTEQRKIGLSERMNVLLHGLRHGRFSMRCKWAAACGEAAAARFISENHLTPLEVQFSRLRTSEPDFLKKSPPDFAKDSVKLPDPLPVLTEENPNPKRALLSPPASRNAAIPESALPSATNHFEDSERRGLQKDLEDTLRAIMRSLRRKLGWRFRLPIEFIQHRLRIARGPLSVALKKRTLLTQATLYTRRLFSNNHRETQSRILGFQVAAYSLETLAFLYREIFIDLDYYFETDEPAPYIIDCGSNIGMSILFFKAMYPHATIVGFEPATDSFAMLRRNIEVNQIQDVVVHPFAVGDAARRVNFFQKGLPGALVASTKIQRVSERSYTVDQVCLSDFIDREVDFLKLDVEGAEAAVLSNLATTGTLRHVRQMAVEYHHHIEANDDCLAEFLAQLEGHGFGYQIRAAFGPAKRRGQFQDFLLYAYRKEHVARSGSQSSDSSGHFKQTEHFSSVVSRK